MRKVAAIISGILLTLGWMFTLSPAANAATTAAYGCSGSQVDTYPVKTSGGSVWGNIYLYYDSSTGKNCAVNVATSAGYYGTPTVKTMDIWRCVAGSTAGTPCQTDAVSQDPTTSVLYSEYAGPVSLSAAGRCIELAASEWSPDGSTIAQANINATHCG